MKYTCAVLLVNHTFSVVQLCLVNGNHRPFLIEAREFDCVPQVGAVIELTDAQVGKIRYQCIHTYILVNDVTEVEGVWQIKGVSTTTGDQQSFRFSKNTSLRVSDLVGRQVEQISTYA